MLRQLCLLSLGAVLVSCVSWEAPDIDGDGIRASDGDCNDLDAEIGPNVAEIWYDGVDQNCDGNDADQDGDGFDSWQVGGPDCWDDPNTTLEGFDVLSTDWTQPTAADVHPDATEVYYDGVDQNCDSLSDFDQDGDGYDTSKHTQRDDSVGDDCIDGSDLDDPNDAGFDAADVHPGVTEDECYDGTNADCDTDTADVLNENPDYRSDFDCDGDGWMQEEECNDEDASIEPNDDPDPFYDCIDSNCDGNDGDQDGDGYVPDDYAATCPDWQTLSGHLGAGDCWDDPSSTPSDFLPLNGFSSTTASEVYPGENVVEIYYDGIDQDCDGNSDFDADTDGHDTTDFANRTGVFGSDCDDNDGNVRPDATEDCGTNYDDNCDDNLNELNSLGCTNYYVDADQDGQGDENSSLFCLCEPLLDVSQGWYFTSLNNNDCDDSEATTYLGADEYCDGHDDDCDSEVDEDASVDVLTWYADQDSDSYGDPATSDIDCYQPSGYVADDTDCRPTDANAYPGADEYCDGHDDDCDTEIDEDASLDVLTWYEDTDSDGYGDPANTDIDCYQPSGYVADNTDCRPGDANAYPGADEYCDGHDDDCDTEIDEDSSLDATTWFADQDSDGYGDVATNQVDCYQPSGYVTDSTDCRPNDADAYPGADEYCDGHDDNCDTIIDEDTSLDVSTWYADGDSDGFGDAASTDIDCYQPTGYVADNTDCDDTLSHVNPDGTEVCDSSNNDEDCDGTADDADPDVTGLITYYTDSDSDGFGDSSDSGVDYCDPPSGVVADNTDCNDADSAIKPTATEVCDTADTDEDCDGGADDADPDGSPATTDYYTDGDGDGFGDASATAVVYCDPTASVVTDNTDCDDTDSAINPDGTEICDTANDDEDCDGGADDDDPDGSPSTTDYYTDADEDGYGDESATAVVYCDPPTTVSTDNTDCDDTDGTINPGATEICDASDVDEDCNGLADDDDTNVGGQSTYYADSDSDGYGDSTDTGTDYCDAPSGLVTDNTDCDDTRDFLYPYDIDSDSIIDGCGWIDVTASDRTTAGIDSSGSIQCWGGGSGWGWVPQCPTTGTYVQIVSGRGTSGGGTACALDTAGAITCWGDNTNGQKTEAPTTGTYTFLAGEGKHFAGIDSNGDVEIWGLYDDSFTGPFVDVATSNHNQCKINSSGGIECDSNSGNGDTYGETSTAPSSGTYDEVECGSTHCCALDTTGLMTCWGRNHQNQATAQSGTWDKLSSKGTVNCGLKTNGDVDCWACYTSTQARCSSEPTSTVGYVDLENGAEHVCAIDANGAMDCWGADSFGETVVP